MNRQLEDGSPEVIQHEEQRRERGKTTRMGALATCIQHGAAGCAQSDTARKGNKRPPDPAGRSNTLSAGDVVSRVGKPNGHAHRYWRCQRNCKVQDQCVKTFALAVNDLITEMIHRGILVQFFDCLYVFVWGAIETTQFPLQFHYSYYKTIPDLSYWELIITSNRLTIAIKSQWCFLILMKSICHFFSFMVGGFCALRSLLPFHGCK